MLEYVFVLLCLLVVTSNASSGRSEHTGTIYNTYVATPAEIDLFWADQKGVPFRQFRTLQAALLAQSKSIKFVMNGGIFEPGGIPSGLLVLDGKLVHPLNTSEGRGNFYLKPNGVFYVDSSGAHILPTEQYRSANLTPRIGLQSGPLLLYRNQIHPSFRRNSTNYLHRNGVGTRKDGKVVFAITEFGQARYPNLYEFSEFFRSNGCEDALFLDGDISQMVTDASEPITSGNRFGAIFAITRPKQNE